MKRNQRRAAYCRKTAQQRKQELIDAGIACLREGGLSAFTIDRICRAAGVSRGLINHHFKTKDDLLVSIYAQLTEHLVADDAAGNSIEALISLVETSFDESSFNRANLRAWLAIWAEVGNIDRLHELHRQRYRDYQQRIEAALRGLSGHSAADIGYDSVSRQLIALIDGLWLEYCLHAEGFSLAEAKADCYRFLRCAGLEIPADLAESGIG